MKLYAAEHYTSSPAFIPDMTEKSRGEDEPNSVTYVTCHYYSSSIMDSSLEVCRQTHEELDRFERALYTLLSRSNSLNDTRLKNEHKAAQVLDRIDARVIQLNNLYDDTQARQAEINALSSATGDLTEFYNRLKKIQEHHSKYPDSTSGGFDLEIAAFLDEPEEDDEDYEDRKCC
jgi:splicing factor 3A subunit 3